MSEPTFICTRCHGEAPMSERREFDARDYCPRCLDAITAICHICGTRIPLTHNHGTEDVPLCEKCLHTRNHAGIEDYCYKARATSAWSWRSTTAASPIPTRSL